MSWQQGLTVAEPSAWPPLQIWPQRSHHTCLSQKHLLTPAAPNNTSQANGSGMAAWGQEGGEKGRYRRRADTGKGGREAGGVGGWLTAAPPGSNTTQANGFCPG